MRKMGVSVVEHPKGSGELYLLVCHQYKKKYIHVGKNTKVNRVIANQKKELINQKIKEQGHKALNRLFEIKSQAPTLEQYLNGFDDNPGWLIKNKKRLKYSTYKGYENLINQRLIPKYGDKPLDQFDKEEFENYLFELSELKPKGLKYNTLANIKNCLSGILESAVPKYIESNPIHGSIIPKDNPDENHDDMNPFTWEDRSTFESKVKEHRPRYYALVAMGFRSGLRIGEIIGLKVSDIDFVNNYISVRNNITRGRKTTPKSESSRRKVRLTNDLKAIIHKQIAAVKEETLRKGWKKTPELVFIGETGNRINYGNFLDRVWNFCMEKSKLSHRTPHDMRHSYATFRLSIGHPIHEVSKELGHSSPMITYKTYYHWIPQMSTSNIDELDKKPTRELLENKPENMVENVSSGNN